MSNNRCSFRYRKADKLVSHCKYEDNIWKCKKKTGLICWRKIFKLFTSRYFLYG